MLTVTTAPDLANGVIVVTLRGCLALETAPAVRTALLKCFADGPEAVLVDVSGLEVDRRARLTVFPAALRAGGSESTVLLLFGASPKFADVASGGVLGPVGLYATWEDALAGLAARPLTTDIKRHRLTLEADWFAPARARAMVTRACQSWGMTNVCGPATQVVSELVSNSVEHAGAGDVHLAVALRGDYLHLSVRDHSARRPVGGDQPGPRAERGRGLFLVDVYATAWGINAAAGGKTVWATFRATPVTVTRQPGCPDARGAP
ncbi:hypothetical protein K1W54_25470 [Micromonospora sp. CPCC 205371]|nr:hypothetical protein [Micromonospora sp. CPCC 205371]